MLNYVLKRLLLMIPTLFGIMLVSFLIVQAAPGGPVEQLLSKFTASTASATSAISQAGASDTMGAATVGGSYRGAQGLPPELVAEVERMYGFDKPPMERFWQMLGNYLRLDFGNSFFQDRPVIDLIAEKLPVSISLGLWSMLIIYLIAIPLGIKKAVHHGSRFDVWSSFVIIIGYAIPGFLFAMMLIVLFAGGSFVSWFPLRGIVSDNWDTLSTFGQIKDYLWHLVLPVTALVIGGFASLAMLTKNSFLEEIRKQYVMTARAKGCSERRVLYGHVFRNAMLIIIAGFPAAFIGILFTGALLIEVIFSLDGMGLLGYEAAIGRDYPIVFGTLFIFTLIGLMLNLLNDIMYVVVDPRIDFEGR